MREKPGLRFSGRLWPAWRPRCPCADNTDFVFLHASLLLVASARCVHVCTGHARVCFHQINPRMTLAQSYAAGASECGRQQSTLRTAPHVGYSRAAYARVGTGGQLRTTTPLFASCIHLKWFRIELTQCRALGWRTYCWTQIVCPPTTVSGACVPLLSCFWPFLVLVRAAWQR